MPYRRNGKWYADVRGDGRRVRKLLRGVTNRPDAVRAENQLARRLLHGEREPAPLVSTYLETVYLPWARANKARPKIDERFVRMIQASPQFKNRRLPEVSAIQVEGFKRELRAAKSNRGTPYRPGSVNNCLAVLSRAFRLASDSGLCRGNPCRLVKYLDLDQKPPRTLARSEEPRLFKALAGRPRYLAALARAILLTGARPCEALALDESDFDFGRDLLFVKNPKWRRDHRKTEGVPLSAAARALFIGLCRCARGRPLFTNDAGRRITVRAASGLFSDRARSAGLAGLTLKGLRHTFGTRLGEAGASPYEIARLMGHGQLNTSMIYVHPSTADLRARLEAVGHYSDTRRAEKVG